MAEEIVVIFVFLMLGGVLKGAVGLGTPVIAVPAIAAFFGVPFAVAVLILPNIVTNSLQAWQFRAERHHLPFLNVFVGAGLIGVLAGTWVLTTLAPDTLALALALIVVAYIIVRVARPDWRIAAAAAPRLAIVLGGISGVLQGATGISAPTSVTFLNALRLTRPQFVLAVSALFAGFAYVQLPALAVAGIFDRQVAAISLVAVAPVLLGMVVGNHLAARLNPRTFDIVILVVLAGIAAKLFYDVAMGAG